MKKLLQQYKAAYSGLPKAAWLLSLVILINRTGTMVLFFMTLYLTGQMGFTISAAGQMISIYGVGALVGSLLGGWLSSKIGAFKVQFFSLILSGIGFIFLGFTGSRFGIAAFLFFIAVVAEAFRPANATAMADVCPPEIRARGFALNRLAVNVGVTIGPAIGGILATINYLYLFWIDGISCIFAAVLLWHFFHGFKSDYKKEELKKEKSEISVWRDYIFLALMGLLFIMGIAFFQLFNTWPLYLKNSYNLLEDKIGWLLAINALLVSIFEMPLVHKLETKNVIKISGFGGFLLLLGFGIIPFGETFIYAAFTVVIWSVGEMLVFPFLSGFIANRATDKNRGNYMGLFSFTFSLALVVGPVLGTWIYATFTPEKLWYGVGIVGFFVWLGFVLINGLLKAENK